MQYKLFDTKGHGDKQIQRILPSMIKGFKRENVRPFLRYPGSKYNASKFIAPFWSVINFDEYREPF